MVFSRPTIPAIADVQFDLEYDGPALAAHEMDVRALAPALISAADLLQELNRTLYPANPDITVNVRAHSEGSFVVELKMVLEEIEGVLISDPAVATVQLMALLGFVGGIITFLAKRRRNRIVSQSPPDAAGMVTVTFADGTSLQIPAEVLRASDSLKIRRDVAELTRPLRENAGIETVTIRREEIEIVKANREDAHVLADEASDLGDAEVLSSSQRDVHLTILNAAFQPGNKWRFTEGGSPFFATILDAAFNARIEEGEPFAKDDRLRVRLRETQYEDDSGLHIETDIIEVFEHTRAGRGTQGTLDIGDTG